jgi:hypothetical protein
MLTDHKVPPRYRNEIKIDAIDYRKRIFGDKIGGIRAANAIIKLTQEYNKNGQPWKLEFRNASKMGAPAIVSYRPPKVEFDRNVWTKALLAKDPTTNYIAAHEIGHMLLHNHDAQPYSGIKKDWISFNEESAEWQADTFADYFLVIDDEIYGNILPSLIADSCQVPRKVADRRFFELAKVAECSCPKCCGSRVYRLRNDHVCSECWHVFM